MGMSAHVIGFKPPDEKFKKMKAIWDQCNELDIEIPDEVYDYFNGEEPDEAGVEVNIKTTDWSDENRQGYEINVDDIPNGVKTIRFYNS